MITKYNFDVPSAVIKSDVNRLTNQLWKLIPMRENGENWQNQLDTVSLEIIGLKELFNPFMPKLLILLSKLEGLKTMEVPFDLYRKTIFESISLLRELGYE